MGVEVKQYSFTKMLLVILALLLVFEAGLYTTTVSAKEKVQNVSQLHELAKKAGKVKLKENNLIVKIKKGEFQESDELYLEYLNSIESINRLASRGLVTITSGLELIPATPEVIEEISYESTAYDTDETIITEPEVEGGVSILVAVPDLPTLNLKSLVQRNRSEIEKVYNDWINLAKYDRYINPFNNTAVWWVGRVKTGGPWDYKSVPGYSPYNKQWWAYTYQGYRQISSEYLGNYNYAYTGELIFTLQVLYVGGQYASGNIFIPEDYNDRTAISRGFNDAVIYE